MSETWKTTRLCSLMSTLKVLSQKLWEDIDAVDDPRAYYIPPENKKEAKLRIEFIDQMLKKHSRMFNSRQPVDYLYGNLERHKGKLHPEQITIPGVKSDADEVKEIDILVEAMKDPKWFFDEPHHVGCRKLFDTEEESNV